MVLHTHRPPSLPLFAIRVRDVLVEAQLNLPARYNYYMTSLTLKPCEETDCKNPSKARGLCMKHYNYHTWRGTLPPLKSFTDPASRYEHWIDRSDPSGCWLWGGALSSGYGVIAVNGGNDYVHRWAYETFVGPIPDGLIVGHVCHDLDLTCRGGECVHRRCGRPDHLSPMSKGDNLRAGRMAMLTRERGQIRRATRTHCRNGHEWTEEDLYIRPSDGAHICRACTRESGERYKRKLGIATRPYRDRAECPQGHPYDTVNSQGSRVCTICAKEAQARYRERMRQSRLTA